MRVRLCSECQPGPDTAHTSPTSVSLKPCGLCAYAMVQMGKLKSREVEMICPLVSNQSKGA